MHIINYLLAPAGWTHEDPNPFTADGAYGPEWSCFRIRDDEDWRGGNRRRENGLFAFVVGRGWPHGLSASVADFIRYESMHGRRCIISAPGDSRAFVEKALAETPGWSVVRPSDPKWMVHSTTAQGWASIQNCGELRSHQRVCGEGVALPNLGAEWFDEPADYAEYILLAKPGVMMPEFVVASKNANQVITEPHTPYTPGARMFFDGHRLIRDGLVVRDGLHRAKVRDRLPLSPYLIAAITPGDLDPEGNVAEWTPESFCLAALDRFSDIVGEAVPYEHWC